MKVCPHQEVALCCSLNFVVCLDDENGNGDVVVLSMAKLRSTMKKRPILKASIKDNSRTSRRLVLSPVLVSNSHEQEYCRSAQVSHHLHLLRCHYHFPYHHNLHYHLDNQSSHFLVTNSRTQARSGDITRGETGTSPSKEDQVRTQFEYCCSIDRFFR